MPSSTLIGNTNPGRFVRTSKFTGAYYGTGPNIKQALFIKASNRRRTLNPANARKPMEWKLKKGANGANGIRTHDLLHAMQALSQLSYGPEVNQVYQIRTFSASPFFNRLSTQSNPTKPPPSVIASSLPPRGAATRQSHTIEHPQRNAFSPTLS